MSKDMMRTKKSLEVALKAHKESVQKAREIESKIKVCKVVVASHCQLHDVSGFITLYVAL